MTTNLDRGAKSAFRPLHHWRRTEGFQEPLEATVSSTDGDPYFVIYADEGRVLLYAGFTQGRLRLALQREGRWETLRHLNTPPETAASFVLAPVGDASVEVRPAGDRPFVVDVAVALRDARIVQGVGDWTFGVAEERVDDVADRLVTDLPAIAPLACPDCQDLIYDVGMHNGSDTEFYLKKGFRVVAVEANPILAARNARRFSTWIEAGRLVIVNMGVSNVSGRLTFHVNDTHTEWSSFNPQIAARGFETREIQINAAPLERMFETFGVPYFLKIDIEGMDAVAVEAACGLARPPFYISFENGNVRSFEKLVAAGYTRFKMVPQSNVMDMDLPNPSREGLTVEHAFPYGSSGPFGEDTPGDWMDAAAMRTLLGAHFEARKALKEEDYEWWDMHAALPEPGDAAPAKPKPRSRKR